MKNFKKYKQSGYNAVKMLCKFTQVDETALYCADVLERYT